MSGPTKGMVAGQPIQTGAQTKEFDEGYDRIFGPDRKATRGRWRFDPQLGKCVEIGADWSDAEKRAETVTEELVHGKIVAPDGTDISSRRKRAEYMRRNGVADASDFKETWAKAERDREAFYRAERVDPGLRHAVGKAEYELSKRKKR